MPPRREPASGATRRQSVPASRLDRRSRRLPLRHRGGRDQGDSEAARTTEATVPTQAMGTLEVRQAIAAAQEAAASRLAEQEASIQAGVRVSKIAPDYATKGVHIHVNGIELKVLPGEEDDRFQAGVRLARTRRRTCDQGGRGGPGRCVRPPGCTYTTRRRERRSTASKRLAGAAAKSGAKPTSFDRPGKDGP